MGFPIVYRQDKERFIATFDFVEIASGLGFTTFLGTASEDGSGVSYHLLTNADAWSDPIGTERTGVGTTELNFDTSPFNLQRVAKGTAYFSAGMGQAGSGETAKIIVQLIHVDSDSVETTISSEITTATKTASGTTGVMYFVPIPITEKIFEQGSSLRLEVKMVKVSGGNLLIIGHDPANQFQTASNFDPANGGTTTMRLFMPFKLPI